MELLEDLIKRFKWSTLENRKSIAIELANFGTKDSFNILKEVAEGDRYYTQQDSFCFCERNWKTLGIQKNILITLEDQLIAIEALGDSKGESKKLALEYLKNLIIAEYEPGVYETRDDPCEVCGDYKRSFNQCLWCPSSSSDGPTQILVSESYFHMKNMRAGLYNLFKIWDYCCIENYYQEISKKPEYKLILNSIKKLEEPVQEPAVILDKKEES